MSTEAIFYKDAVKLSMASLLKDFPHTVLMGQGVTDPIRMFGTLHGLLEEYGPDRVVELPICEDGTTGMGLGAALNGLYPIQTHIRVDFLILAMNQIVNHLAKYRYMYGGAFETPMLIRAVVGRSWGQGPQHSQSLQSLFSHIPGLKVVMPASASSLVDTYRYAVERHRGPVLSIEHRFLYDTSFFLGKFEEASGDPFSARVVEEGSDVTIVATSYMVQEAQRAARWTRERKGIQPEIIDVHCTSDVDHELIYRSVSKTGRLIVADTSWVPYGVCAEVCRGVVSRNPGVLRRPVHQIGLKHTPAPTSHSLEKYFYPDMGTIVDSIYRQVSEGDCHDFDLPSDEFKKSQRAKFKGPF